MIPSVSLVISINVHEKPTFLMKQIDNITSFVKSDFVIILNCNDYMFEELKDNKSLPSYVYINHEVINKQTNHGSLMHGIYKNMLYALQHFNFQYFIILSSRNMFYNEITYEYILNKAPYHPHATNLSEWVWPHVRNTKLVQNYLNKSCNLYSTAHEGLIFSMNVCKNITNMLENNKEIRDELFHFVAPVEEFALQTISMNEIDVDNKEFGWIHIGNGIHTELVIPTDKTYAVYKTLRI